MSRSDDQLLELLQSRDETALSALQSSCAGSAAALSLDILHSAEDAEECVNDALLRVWNSIPPACPVSVRAYFLRTVRNLSLDRLKAKMRQKRDGLADLGVALEELADCLPDLSDDENETALRDLLADFLRNEEPLDRALFMGRYWYATPVGDLASERGLSRFAVSRRLKATRERLRARLCERGYRYDETNE